MRDKDKTVELMKQSGYDAAFSDGMVMVRVPAYKSDKADTIRSQIKKKLSEIGYECSWGITYARQPASVSENEVLDDSASLEDVGYKEESEGVLEDWDGDQMSLFPAVDSI